MPGHAWNNCWRPCRSVRHRWHCPRRAVHCRSSNWWRGRPDRAHRFCAAWVLHSTPAKRWPWWDPRPAARRRWRACWWGCGPPPAARCGWTVPMSILGTRANWARMWAICPRESSCSRARWPKTLRVLAWSNLPRWRRPHAPWDCTTSFCRCPRATTAR